MESISFSSFKFKKNPVAIFLKIAGTTIRIRAENLSLINSIKGRFGKFLSRHNDFLLNLDVHLSTDIHFLNPDGTQNYFNSQTFQNNKCFVYSNFFAGYIEIKKNYSKLISSDYDPLSWFEHFLRVVYAVVALRRGEFLFHGAGLVTNGKGFIFFGPSGSGKSTVTQLSRQCIVLGDDLIALKRHGEHLYVYATPFNSEENGFQLTNTCALVKGFYRLIKDKSTFVRKMSQANAMIELLSNISAVNRNYQGSLTAVEIASQIVNQIQCYEMHFTRDNKFWRYIDENYESVSY